MANSSPLAIDFIALDKDSGRMLDIKASLELRWKAARNPKIASVDMLRVSDSDKAQLRLAAQEASTDDVTVLWRDDSIYV